LIETVDMGIGGKRAYSEAGAPEVLSCARVIDLGSFIHSFHSCLSSECTKTKTMTTTGKRSYENAITSITTPGSTGKCVGIVEVTGDKTLAFIGVDTKAGKTANISLSPPGAFLSQSNAGIVPVSAGKDEMKQTDEKTCTANIVATSTSPPAGTRKATVPGSDDETPAHDNKTPVPSKAHFCGKGLAFSNGNCDTDTASMVNPDQLESARFHWCNDPAFTKLILDFLIKDLDYKKHVHHCMLEEAEIHRRHHWETQSILSFVDKFLNAVTADHPELVSAAVFHHHEVMSCWTLIDQNIRRELAKAEQQQVWAAQAVENSALFFQVLVHRLAGFGVATSDESSNDGGCPGDRPSESHRPYDMPSIGLLDNLKMTTSPTTANLGDTHATVTANANQVELERTVKKQKLYDMHTGDIMNRAPMMMPMTPVAAGLNNSESKVTAAAFV
jgi:hypothetical protein